MKPLKFNTIAAASNNEAFRFKTETQNASVKLCIAVKYSGHKASL